MEHFVFLQCTVECALALTQTLRPGGTKSLYQKYRLGAADRSGQRRQPSAEWSCFSLLRCRQRPAKMALLKECKGPRGCSCRKRREPPYRRRCPGEVARMNCGNELACCSSCRERGRPESEYRSSLGRNCGWLCGGSFGLRKGRSASSFSVVTGEIRLSSVMRRAAGERGL